MGRNPNNSGEGIIHHIQVVKTVKIIFPPFFLWKFIVKISKTLSDRRIYHHVFCSTLFGFFPLGLCEWQSRNCQIHRQVCWKRHRISGVVGKQRNIGFIGFLGNVEPKWCRKYRKWLCCEIFVTKSKLKASLAVWRNLLPYIFQGGLQPGSQSRRAALVAKGRKMGRAEAMQIWAVYFQRYHCLFLSVCSVCVLKSRLLKLKMNLAAYYQASSI